MSDDQHFAECVEAMRRLMSRRSLDDLSAEWKRVNHEYPAAARDAAVIALKDERKAALMAEDNQENAA